jgi:hypothetical protein
MKSFLVACVTAIVLAVIGWGVLDSIQRPADEAFSTPYVRVGA